MTQSDFGPINITQGNVAQFVAEFFDSNGNITNPSSATLTISYTNTSNASQSDIVSLIATGSFYTGTWSSRSPKYGIADWSIITSVSTTVAQSGQIRVIDP